jgi:hypothetical protein
MKALYLIKNNNERALLLNVAFIVHQTKEK